jgi:hypothetical protein
MDSQDKWRSRAKMIALVYGLVLVVLLGRQWWNVVHNVMPCTQCKSDFLSLYTGGSLLWTDSSSLYNLEKQKNFQVHVQPEQGDWVLPFLNPPFAAAALVPLAWFSFQSAYFLISIANLLLLILSLRQLIRHLDFSNDQIHWLLLFTMANVGTRVAFFQGQTSFILLFILTSFFVAWKRGFEIKAGIWSSLAWFKPQIATVVMALTIVPVRWRFLWASAISTLLLAASSLLIVGPKGTQDFLSLMHQAMLGNNDLSINAARMHNLRALSISLLPHPWETYLWLSLTIMVGLTALKMNFRNLRSRSFSERIFWIMIAVLLVAPHLHTHDLTILIIPVAFFLQQCGKQIPVAYGFVTILLAVLPLISVRPLPPLIPLVLLLVFMLGPKILPGYGQTEGNSRLISFCSQLRTRKLGVR